MAELKPCPFCGGYDIRYSTKVSGGYNALYHATMYCNKCHCYGPRVRSTRVGHYDYNNRDRIVNDKALEDAAAYAWNRRVNDEQNV